MSDRFTLRGITRALMLAENLGDVHDEINHLHDLLGIPRPEGNFLDGWTDTDFRAVEEAEDDWKVRRGEAQDDVEGDETDE
jgi:hypothetical protein